MIRAYCGLLGAGKTLNMVNDTVRVIKAGKKVFSNVPIKFLQKGVFLQATYLPSNQLEKQLMHETNALFCIDEASLVLPNYFWKNLPMDYLIRFAQSRKYGLDIFYTSQGWTHTVKRLRDLTNEIVMCEKHSILPREDELGHKSSMFGLDFYTGIVYDPEFFNYKIISNSQMERKYVHGRRFISPFKAKKVYQYYDTLHTVMGGLISGQSDDVAEMKQKSVNNDDEMSIF